MPPPSRAAAAAKAKAAKAAKPSKPRAFTGKCWMVRCCAVAARSDTLAPALLHALLFAPSHQR
jgi:hypothetical protein